MTLYKWSKTANSNATADSTINWAEGQAPSSVNDSARAMMAATAEYRDDTSGSLVTGGTSTAYTITSNQVFDTLAHMSGKMIAFSPNATCGATVTLNVDGLGAKPLRSSPGVELAAGALISGACYTAVYNNSDVAFYLRDYTPTIIAANQVVTASITNANVTYAKIQNVTASSLLGNPTGSGAAPSEISLGAGLSFSGTSMVSTLDPALVPGFLGGLTLSTAGSSATFAVAAGVCNDVASGGLMTLGSFTKTTSSWAVGTGNGGLDTGAIATGTWYHVFVIKRTDTGVVDVLFSLSPTSPTMPTSYTLKRRIGSMKTDGSSKWTSFTQTGDQFLWPTMVTDVSNVTSTGSRVNKTLSTPTGIVTTALIRLVAISGASSSALLVTSLQETDQTPIAGSGSVGPSDLKMGSSVDAATNLQRLTDTSSQVGIRGAGSFANYSIFTYGWIDTRGVG